MAPCRGLEVRLAIILSGWEVPIASPAEVLYKALVAVPAPFLSYLRDVESG